jgi:hypothetical protein
VGLNSSEGPRIIGCNTSRVYEVEMVYILLNWHTDVPENICASEDLLQAKAIVGLRLKYN